jgi:hypothetical protein
LSLEALNSLFAREGLEEITTTTIDVTRSFSDFDDFWRAQTPIFNPITGMITALPESDRVRLIESVQAGGASWSWRPRRPFSSANAIKADVPE